MIPRIVPEESTQESSAVLEDTAILNCTVFSSEERRIAWERNDQTLSDDEKVNITIFTGREVIGGNYSYSVLTVSEISRDDNGTYVCVALDGLGDETDRSDFSITVLGMIKN